jgi:ribosomal protein S12 methylthiotransferase accessory factor
MGEQQQRQCAALRPAILNLPELDDDACGELLDTLNASSFDEQRLVRELIGLAADPGTLWEDLRVGELKTLLALACGDEEAIRAGLEWIVHFEQIDDARRRVYRCIDTLLQLDDSGRNCGDALELLFDAETLATAQALLDGSQRFFAIPAPGDSLNVCGMHQRLLAAYAKAQAALSK